MSIARVHYVEHARQTYEKVAKLDEDGNPVVTAVTSKRTGEQKTSAKGRPISRRIRVADKEKPKPLAKCGRCRDEIQIGSPYRWFTVGFRGFKQVRCMKASCTPKQSELESRGPISTIYAAIEDAEANLDGLDTMTLEVSDVEEEVHTAAEAWDEAATSYREADENFGGGGNTEMAEWADTCDSAYQDLSSWAVQAQDEPEKCDLADEDEKHDSDSCEDCQRLRDEWAQEIVQEAKDALSEAEIP